MWRRIEGEASYILREAGLVDFVRVPLRPAIEAVLGHDSVVFVPRRKLPQDVRATVRQESGRQVIRVAHASVEEMRFFASLELGHVVLGHGEHRDEQAEAEADRFAAALLMPWRAFHVMRGELGDDLELLAEAFAVSQTAVALRLGEIGEVAAVAVVTPEQVRMRALAPIVLPTEQDWRDYARMTVAELENVGPGLRKAEITDGQRRVALVVDDEVGT